jgi:hypothetical protein
MQERTQEHLRLTRPTAPSGGIFDEPGSAPGTVIVTHGIYRSELPVGEMSVAQVRGRFRDQLDIHPQATAVLDGSPADEDTTLRAGQTLTFVRPSGEKGQ